VVTGGRDAAELARLIPGALDLTGKTSLRQLVALLERSDLVIANDSGPMHIAAALGRPLVTMFGPTNPSRTGPWGREDSVVHVEIPCSPCYSRRCSHTSCMKWLTVEAVMTVAEKQLAISSPLPVLGERARESGPRVLAPSLRSAKAPHPDPLPEYGARE
jgi:ADP-heptose:LPS heptosyltransferase